MKSKHLRHALGQLAEEGVTRVFKPLAGGDWIIDVVGALQLDVLTERLAAEYDPGTRLDGAPYQAARWLETDDRAELERFRIKNPSASAEDHDGIPVFFARNDGNPGVVASSLLTVHQHTPDGPLIVASFRSVFTAIAAVAPFIRRVSMHTAGSPAACRPSQSHGDSGPASRPRRSIGTPTDFNQVDIDSGSVSTLPSRKIAPALSTTQMAVSSSDTSKPTKYVTISSE